MVNLLYWVRCPLLEESTLRCFQEEVALGPEPCQKYMFLGACPHHVYTMLRARETSMKPLQLSSREVKSLQG